MLKPFEVEARIITAMTRNNTDTQSNVAGDFRAGTPTQLMATFARLKRELRAARTIQPRK